MENITLQELHRDILEIKEQLKTIQEQALIERRALNTFINKVDKRVIKIEARAAALSVMAGSLTGLAGEIIARLFSQ